MRILALGDSLTAGFNLDHRAAFPVQLEAALRDKGYDVKVENAGVSGDTTAGGLARLDWALGGSVPDITILELGANDALRGIPPDEAKANLTRIVEGLEAAGSRILLAGMWAPPNMGRDYAEAFNAIYPDLAADHDLPLYPFFLDGVITRPELLQNDGMHPTADGVTEIVKRILPMVEEMIVAVRKEDPS